MYIYINTMKKKKNPLWIQFSFFIPMWCMLCYEPQPSNNDSVYSNSIYIYTYKISPVYAYIHHWSLKTQQTVLYLYLYTLSSPFSDGYTNFLYVWIFYNTTSRFLYIYIYYFICERSSSKITLSPILYLSTSICSLF